MPQRKTSLVRSVVGSSSKPLKSGLSIDVDLNPFDDLKGAEDNLAIQYESASEEPMSKVKQVKRGDDLLNLEGKIGDKANSVRSPRGPLDIAKRKSSESTRFGSRIRGRTPPALNRNTTKQSMILEQAFIPRSNKQALAMKAMLNQKFDGAFQKKKKKLKKKKRLSKRKSNSSGYDVQQTVPLGSGDDSIGSDEIVQVGSEDDSDIENEKIGKKDGVSLDSDDEEMKKDYEENAPKLEGSFSSEDTSEMINPAIKAM